MEYEVYIDVLFLVDFFCSFLALSLAARMLKRKFLFYRALLSAIVGSLWSCFVTVFPLFPISVELGLTILLIGGLMAALAFPSGDLRAVLKASGVVLLACVLMGGVMMTLKQFLLLKDWEAVFCLSAVWFGVRILTDMRQSEKARGQERYPVRLYYRGACKQFTALCDSGNRLREPVSQKPVSVISYGDCRGFCDKVDYPVYIPFRAVGTEAGLLAGMIFEKMEILKGEEWLEVERPIVAVTKEPLAVAGDFTMLLPEELILSVPAGSCRGGL